MDGGGSLSCPWATSFALSLPSPTPGSRGRQPGAVAGMCLVWSSPAFGSGHGLPSGLRSGPSPPTPRPAHVRLAGTRGRRRAFWRRASIALPRDGCRWWHAPFHTLLTALSAMPLSSPPPMRLHRPGRPSRPPRVRHALPSVPRPPPKRPRDARHGRGAEPWDGDADPAPRGKC